MTFYSNPNKKQGFTLLELVVVVLILGILAVFLTPKNTSVDATLSAMTRQVANDIQLTRSLAMSRGERYRINFFSTYYTIFNRDNSQGYTHPGSNSVTINLLNQITLSASPSLLVFNGLGTPYSSAALPGALLASVATITLTATNGATRQIQVTPDTGRVTQS